MKRLNLLLHCGANHVDRNEARRVSTPPATRTHCPVPHGAMIDETLKHFDSNGYEVVQEAHGLGRDGNHYFGLFQVRTLHNLILPGGMPEVSPPVEDGDTGLVFGLRNAHDKAFAAGWAFGGGVFVCDNLCFSGLVNLRRRHTRYILRDLPRIVASAMNRLTVARKAAETREVGYKDVGISNREAHDLIIQGLDTGATTATKIPEILKQWRTPAHPEFNERNAWSLQNAFTETYKGIQPNTLLRRSEALNGLLDTHCKIAV